jgi:hypothetical protein
MKKDNEVKILSDIKTLIDQKVPEKFNHNFIGESNDYDYNHVVNEGKANTNIITSESNGIKIEITGTVSDKSRTVFEIKIFGLNLKTNETVVFKNIKLIDEDGNEYKSFKVGADLQPVKDAVVNSLEFDGGPGKNTNLFLSFDAVNDIEGSWNFIIPVNYFESREFAINIRYDSGDEIWQIDKISSGSPIASAHSGISLLVVKIIEVFSYVSVIKLKNELACLLVIGVYPISSIISCVTFFIAVFYFCI